MPRADRACARHRRDLEPDAAGDAAGLAAPSARRRCGHGPPARWLDWLAGSLATYPVARRPARRRPRDPAGASAAPTERGAPARGRPESRPMNLALSVLDQSAARRRQARGRGDPRHARSRRALRGARLPPLLAQRAPRPAHHRRHGPGTADGGRRGAHLAHPHRQRRRDAAALLGPQGGRAVPRAGGAGARPHRPRRRPRSGRRPAHRAGAQPERGYAAERFPRAGARPAGLDARRAAPRHRRASARRPPTRRPPELWMLGSSDYGARLAADFGLPYAFAYFFTDGQGVETALSLYRALYKPSARHPAPHATVCVWALAAETEAEARHHALSRDRWRLDRARGRFGALRPPDEIAAEGFTDAERPTLEAARARAFVGDAARWRASCARWPRPCSSTNWWSTPGPTTRPRGAAPTRCSRANSGWPDSAGRAPAGCGPGRPRRSARRSAGPPARHAVDPCVDHAASDGDRAAVARPPRTRPPRLARSESPGRCPASPSQPSRPHGRRPR